MEENHTSSYSSKTPDSKPRLNKHCCVPGCQMNLYEYKGRKVSYHRFPRDVALCNQWIEKIWGKSQAPPAIFNRGLVCSLHFPPDERVLVHTCYPARYYLQIGVIPSIFPNTEQWLSLHNQSEIEPSPSSKPAIIPPYQGPSMELQRWPPDIQIQATDLNSLFVCTLCNGYFYNATTITECLHTFCKSCLVKHVDRSLHCPKCKILIHPTDPFVHMRHDSTIQDIMFRIFPNLESENQKKEEEFYVSRGLPWPPKEKEPEEPKGKAHETHYAAVMLDYAGASSELGRFEPLQKHYLWIPDKTTIRHLHNFLKKKLNLPSDIQEEVLELQYGLTKNSLNIFA
ncbi:hypothetical protein CAPTEDRAFT_225467 [Capitella teleta]|uniref:RING-type domain-containing protein n=1 Tax=Capitella teleta TaxID=283909 RepID=R7TL35_CAPTE|nr:hypothetical protein CAPTEDRAFT_225467 [Capitella teleta]|eukprot:ELT94558.1 hypothetical protein CAPTEDRAFT_225467 [Capitella teleta]